MDESKVIDAEWHDIADDEDAEANDQIVASEGIAEKSSYGSQSGSGSLREKNEKKTQGKDDRKGDDRSSRVDLFVFHSLAISSLAIS